MVQRLRFRSRVFGTGWWFSAATAVSGGGVVLMVLGVVIAVGLAGWVLRFGRFGGQLPPGGGRESSPFGTRYGIAVLLMVVGIFAGSRLLTGLDLPQAVPAWVLFVVGLHFAPFVKLFGSSRFLWLACSTGRNSPPAQPLSSPDGAASGVPSRTGVPKLGVPSAFQVNFWARVERFMSQPPDALLLAW